MDIATSLGLLAGVIVLCTLILMGGDLRMFLDAYAAIVIFGGAFAATLIRFPLSSIFTPRMSIPRKHRRRHLPTNDRQQAYSARFKEDRKFSLASASLRQALQDMPEISETSKHIMLEETRQGLNIEIVDQDGRSMFADGAKEPLERTRKLIQKIAPQLKAMPYRLSITGHTASSKVPPKPGYGPWELSADRANAVRQILDAEGVPSGNIYLVAGKADTDPLFPDDPYMSPNRRVTITLMREEPPLPDNLTP